MTAWPDHDLWTPRNQEGFKGAVHALLLLSLGTVGAYNVAAYRARQERHLLVNALVYAGLTAFEIYQVWRHWRDI